MNSTQIPPSVLPHRTRRPGLTARAILFLMVILTLGLLAVSRHPRAIPRACSQPIPRIRLNLRSIDSAKTQWAAENRKDPTAVPTEGELAPFFNGGRFPVAVVGETYQIRSVAEQPIAFVPARKSNAQAGKWITLE